jgi:hypothetical protein
MIHSCFHVCWQMFLRPSCRIVAIETKREAFKPSGHLFDVMVALFLWHGTFDYGESVPNQVVAKVAMLWGDVRNGWR